MGFLRTAALLAGGAIAGYLASQAQERSKTTGTDIERRAKSSQEVLSATEAHVAKFFDSSIGRHLQPYAIRAVRFATTVKQGMDEREEQLKTKFDAHVDDIRPGSLDGWDEEPAGLSLPNGVMTTDIIEAQVADAEDTEGNKNLHHRLKRDSELGKDFFA